MALFADNGGPGGQSLSSLDQATRLQYEGLAQQFFGLPLETLVSKMGTWTAVEGVLVGLRESQPGGLSGIPLPGKTGSPIDDLLGGNDDLASKLYAQADAKARAAAAKAQAEQDRRLREDLKWEMRYGSFAMPFDVSAHINAVVKRHGNMAMLLNMVYADKRFKKAFPGILDKHGDLKMSVGEYNQLHDYARASFEASGIKITKDQFGAMVGKNLRPEQIAERAKIAGFIRGNADLLTAVKNQINEMNAARKAQGLPALQGLNTMGDVAQYVTRQGTPELYSSYEGGVIAAAAKRAGLDIAGARARQLGAAAPGLEDFGDAEEKFKTIADRLRVAGVELGQFGLTQGDLETIEFGGQNRGVLAGKAEQALRNFEAARTSGLQAEGLTLQGGRPVQEGIQKVGA